MKVKSFYIFGKNITILFKYSHDLLFSNNEIENLVKS